MKLPKSSHTGDPLAVVLISYLGKDTHWPKIPGNPNETYNTPKLHSRSTNNEEISKKEPSCVVRTLEFSSRLSWFFPKIVWCKPLRFRAAFLVLKHVIFVQLLPFSPRTFRQPTIPSCFSCCPSSTTTQYSLCFRPSTTTPCRPTRKTIIV